MGDKNLPKNVKIAANHWSVSQHTTQHAWSNYASQKIEHNLNNLFAISGQFLHSIVRSNSYFLNMWIKSWV